MTYTELLAQKEWNEKCNHILQRDKYRCKDCGKIGYHNDTFYVTDSLDEVDEFLNEKVLICEKFSSLLEQTLNNCIECDEDNPKGYETVILVQKSLCNNEKAKSIYKVPIVWNPYKGLKPISVSTVDCTNIYKLNLFQPGDYKDNVIHFNFAYILEYRFIYIIINHKVEAFDFCLYRYPKSACIDGKDYSTYPMAVLKFDEELTDKYFLYIDDKSVNLTYKNIAFFVHLSHYQFIYDGLNVHHNYYVSGKKPWEYDDDALLTLCADCHKKRHEREAIPVYKSLLERVVDGYCEVCDKCGGSGYLPQYNYYEHGICFKCRGEGVIVK